MNAGTKTVMVIDDNLVNLQLTGKALKDEGYFIILAQDGKSGIEQLNTQIPDLILLDIMMPEMDGIEVCRFIKANEKWKDIPIIFLTAKNQTEDHVEGFYAGGVDYIIKPFKKEELLARVKNHIDLAGSRKIIFEMNRNREKLFGIIAHDIRSPFASIIQTIEAVNSGFITVDSPDFKEIINNLEIRVRETNTLLESLLEWTKMQSETIQMVFEEVNLYALLCSCIRLFEANAKNKNISVSLKSDSELTLYCDEISMHAVFRNLISNAIKFTPQGGSIDVSVNPNGKSVEIIVEDTGVGMPEIVLKKVFESGTHYVSIGTNQEKGTGLGLTIVKDFIIKNHGEIKADSTVGKGTKIKVTFPVL